MCIAPEMTQFSPINECLSLFATLLTIVQMAKIQAFLCKINKKVYRENFMNEKVQKTRRTKGDVSLFKAENGTWIARYKKKGVPT